jgi:hypothetical protein
VNIKRMAMPVVIFPRKLAGPLLPKTVWLDPPKAAPMLAPFPACRRMTRIRTTQAIICTIVVKICTFNNPF